MALDVYLLEKRIAVSGYVLIVRERLDCIEDKHCGYGYRYRIRTQCVAQGIAYGLGLEFGVLQVAPCLVELVLHVQAFGLCNHAVLFE